MKKSFKNKVLHICNDSQIMSKYSDFIVDNIDYDDCVFFIGRTKYKHPMNSALPILTTSNVIDIMNAIFNSKKIIIHGLWNQQLLLILSLFPSLLKKCYWVMWGGDFYRFNKPFTTLKSRFFEFLRHNVIKKMGYLISYIPKDIEFVRKRYGSKGVYQECIMYPSNTFKNFTVTKNMNDDINIQVGNSADPSNQHTYILDKLALCNQNNLNINIPLSYGDKKYAEVIDRYACKLFRDRYLGLKELMTFDDYTKWLANIDIAIFAHERQQAMGNIITLLGLGKKVFVRRDTAQYELFISLGIYIHSIDDCDIATITDINEVENKINSKIVEDYFSVIKLIAQWKHILV
ncbi:TDP-N-acetylfucosamine:lipid II N-acetylfucosaminyltransferase [Colwellia sp. MB02u-9]|uniref:TDP-N-acetylfucosamine:lipid II N-acetylfucosaminyltransferase n=1 Tax=Colwellia sp. MB02u-9 TaxID=2759823 RepID=UPI0015F6763C|nr:TDP-N-acetylfucosamine:lipid II N-acetylfucosaminyltransferase [Colwellia sp. MB02u-9]MBA6296950.1 TDP-N-acetylfucosamine:lipid II N-acetylfucosaminyltransferase [Colwellia sp. MB02u-9]